MISILKNGPYIRALGWTGGPAYDIQSKASDKWALLERTLDFPEGQPPKLKAPATLDSLMAPLPGPFLKVSGVARARSAAKSTVLAAVLARELAKHIKDLPGFDGNRVGLGVVSNSAIVSVFWRFESVGVGDKWSNTDTMLLPASIPSSVVTAVSSVTNLHASAINYGDGAIGMFAAIEHAYLDFFHDRADHALALCAEEASEQMIDSMKALGIEREPLDGAAGLVLSKDRTDPSDWQIYFVVILDASHPIDLPEGWTDALHFVVAYDDNSPAYTGTAMPQAMHLAMQLGHSQVVVEYRMVNRTRCLMGMRR